MERLPKIAVLTALIQQLIEKGSWCGETHIQKTVYFLQCLLGVPLEFSFILYKRGPYSFELTDELSALLAHQMVELVVLHPSYGPQYQATDHSAKLRDNYPVTLKRYGREIAFITDMLGHKDSKQLERLATALYVTKNPQGEQNDEDYAESIHRLKPHVPIFLALDAMRELHKIEAGTQQLQKEHDC